MPDGEGKQLLSELIADSPFIGVCFQEFGGPTAEPEEVERLIDRYRIKIEPLDHCKVVGKAQAPHDAPIDGHLHDRDSVRLPAFQGGKDTFLWRHLCQPVEERSNQKIRIALPGVSPVPAGHDISRRDLPLLEEVVDNPVPLVYLIEGELHQRG